MVINGGPPNIMRILFFPLAFFCGNNMKNRLFILFTGAFYVNLCAAFAGENIKIPSGGAVSSSGVVKVIGIGAPVSGRGNEPLIGLGLPYVRKNKAAASLRKSAPASQKITVSEISSEFKLGEVYVYPNPAKGGQIPTFHIETGIADSVKITVYTVAGDVAHNYTVTGLPATINDGNGLEYAYEYAWRGHIPSGVYYYIIEAQKAGQKLKKTGKFAVVR